MTTDHKELCERLREEAKAIMSSFANEDDMFAYLWQSADLIESQAKQIDEMERVIQREATVYEKTQAYIAELEEKLGEWVQMKIEADGRISELGKEGNRTVPTGV